MTELTTADGTPYLFVRIPKTASTSICHAIKRPIEHRTAKEWRERLPDFDRRWVFTVVRHPYTRFLSMYYFFSLFRADVNTDVNAYLEAYDIAEVLEHRDGWLMRPQVDYIFDGRKQLVKDIFHYENIDTEWPKILDGLEHPYVPLERKRVCRFDRKEFPELNDESKAKIYAYYAEDFIRLGYDK